MVLVKQRATHQQHFAFAFKVLRYLLKSVLEDEASAKLLFKIWREQQQTDAVGPGARSPKMDEIQARKKASVAFIATNGCIRGPGCLKGDMTYVCRGCCQRSQVVRPEHP